MTAVSKDDQAEREAQHEKVNQPSPQLKKGSPALWKLDQCFRLEK